MQRIQLVCALVTVLAASAIAQPTALTWTSTSNQGQLEISGKAFDTGDPSLPLTVSATIQSDSYQDSGQATSTQTDYLIQLGTPPQGIYELCVEIPGRVPEACESIRHYDAVVTFVAMGDSYSSGEGLGSYDFDGNTTCHRSTESYPALIKDALESQGETVDFDFRACSGARIEHILDDIQIPKGFLDTQGSVLSDQTDLITMSIGGNDADWIGALTGCIGSVNGCVDRIEEAKGDILTTRTELDEVLVRLYDKAPMARIVLVGYPNLFPDPTEPFNNSIFKLDCLPFANGTKRQAIEEAGDLIAEEWTAATDPYGRMTFLDLRPIYDEREACTSPGSNEWINVLAGLGTDPATGHPKAAGHAATAAVAKDDLIADDFPNTAFGLPTPLAVKVNLQGALSGGAMRADLTLPEVQPYSLAPWRHHGVELTVPGPGAVDWILMELRANPDGPAVYRNAGIVDTDGTVTSPDGTAFAFPELEPGAYHLVVRHRNHLAVMGAAPIELR